MTEKTFVILEISKETAKELIEKGTVRIEMNQKTFQIVVNPYQEATK